MGAGRAVASWTRPGRCSRARTSSWPSSWSARTTRWTRCTARLFAHLLSGEWTHGIEPAIDITLIGRYYERYADHAVSVARQVIFLVTGEPPPLPTAISTGATETALGV